MNNIFRIVFIYLFFSQYSTTGFGQNVVELLVLDSISKEPVPFAGIVNPQNKLIGTTSLDGMVKLDISKEVKFAIKCTGYKTRWYTAYQSKLTIYLPPDEFLLDDVVILPGENPAHRIIKQAVKNRDLNNPQKNCRHCYNTYNKLVFKPDEDSLAKGIKSTAEKDSSVMEMLNFFDQQHLFITESLTEKYFNPPAKSSERIIANRVSGFQNPIFSLLATELQSFGYYEDEIKLLGVKYLNPISKGSTDKYKFRLSDTTFDGTDTLYTITFEPRKGKSFKGLKGNLIVHTGQFALKSFKAQPVTEDAGFRIFINQLYEYVNNRQWFPVQLNAKMYLPNNIQLGGNIVLYGDNKGYITNIRFDEACAQKKTDEVELEVVSTERDTSIKRLNNFNPMALDQKEKNTYAKIDSLGDANKFDQKFTRFSQLLSGKIPVGFVNIDLGRIYNYNHHEGSRVGLGLSTNYKISKRHSLSGYIAYGFKDKVMKYGGDLKLLFYPRKQTQVVVSYRNDIIEAAGPMSYFSTNTFLSPENARQLYLRKFDYHEQWQGMFSTRFLKHFQGNVYLAFQERKPLYDYTYLESAGTNTSFSNATYFVTEVGGLIRFGFREKFILADNKLISTGTKWPFLTFRYAQSMQVGEFRNDYTYNRMEVKIEKRFKIRNFGAFNVLVQSGTITGNVPYTFLSSFIASYDKIALSVPNSFESMRLNEFAAKEYVMIFMSHNFLSNLFYNTKSKTQLELFTNIGFGRLPDQESAQHLGLAVIAPEKGFYESGIRLHSLIKSRFSTIGIALGYRYGPYSLSKFTQNAVIKLTTGIVLD